MEGFIVSCHLIIKEAEAKKLIKNLQVLKLAPVFLPQMNKSIKLLKDKVKLQFQLH